MVEPLDEVPDNRFNRTLRAGGSVSDAIAAAKRGTDTDIDESIEIAAFKLYRYDDSRARTLPPSFRERYIEKARIMADHFRAP